VDKGGRVKDRRAFPPNRLAVFGRESGGAARSEGHAPAGGGPGAQIQDVGAHGRDGLPDSRRGTRADFHHSDHSPDTDDDAKGRQHGAHRASAQRRDRPSDGTVAFHLMPPTSAAAEALSRNSVLAIIRPTWIMLGNQALT